MAQAQSVRIDEVVREKSLTAGLAAMLWSAAMVGFGEASFALFAGHLKAPEFYFGLLAGVQVLAGPVAQVFGANWLERTNVRKPIVTRCVFLQVLLFIPFVVLAVGSSRELLLKIFLPMVIVYYVIRDFGGPAWSSLIYELCPSAQRAHYFARNARNSSVMMLIAKVALFGAACWAAAAGSDFEFQRMALVFMGMFGIAGLVRYLSYRACTRMFEPKYAPPADSSFTFWQFIRRAPKSNFVKFSIFVGAFYFGAFVSAPFYVPHVLMLLKREPWEWVIIDIGSTTSAVLTFIYWGHFSARFGNKATISFTSIGITAVPALWILCDNLIWLIAVQCMAGTLWAGFNLSCANYVMEACSPPKRARCFAYFNVFVGGGSFLGAMVGALLVNKANPHFMLAGIEFSVRSSLSYVFIASVLLRFIPCVYLIRLFRELRSEVQPFAVSDWALEIVGARPALGLRFGAIAEKEPPVEPDPPSPSEAPKPEGVTSESGRLG